MNVPQPILIAAKRAGVTPHLIRAWEKRYHAVSPDRTHTNRRLYSEDEIERLRLLGVLTKSGHRIGDIARQSTSDLRQLAALELKAENVPSRGTNEDQSEDPIKESLDAIQRMDSESLETILNRHVIALGQRGLLERLISPLVGRIGDMWIAGSLSAAHEHFASNILRNYLLGNPRAYAEGTNAPVMIVTTPIGQLHELGAAMVAAHARDLGWRVLYLGASLPASDIAHAAVTSSAKAVALSIVYPKDDNRLTGELKRLRHLLPDGTTILAGGRAALSYARTMETTGILVTDDLGDLAGYLTRAHQTVAP